MYGKLPLPMVQDSKESLDPFKTTLKCAEKYKIVSRVIIPCILLNHRDKNYLFLETSCTILFNPDWISTGKFVLKRVIVEL